MTDDELAAIKARRAAIASNWHLRTRHTSSTKELCGDYNGRWEELVSFHYDSDGPYTEWDRHANLVFAVNAPADIDALLTDNARLSAERDEAQAALVVMNDIVDDLGILYPPKKGVHRE